MRLERWALVAEIIGALAVVVSVLYVGFQVRQNSAALEASSVQAVTDSIAEFAADVGGDPELTRIYFNGLSESGGELSPEERNQFDLLMLSVVRRFENAFFQFEAGSIPPEQWRGLSETYDFIACTPGGREWWLNSKDAYSESFVSFIEDASKDCG